MKLTLITETSSHPEYLISSSELQLESISFAALEILIQQSSMCSLEDENITSGFQEK